MFPEPRYLDLEQELFPSITLYKEFIFDNEQDGFHSQLFERVDYDSKNRTIDLTESINRALRNAYHSQQQLRLYVYDPLLSDFKFFAYFPNENNFTLGEQFLQTDLLIFRVKNQDQQEQEEDIAGVDQYDPAQLQIQEQAGAQEKSKKIKNIRELIELVDQWRKLYYQSHGKLSLEEGASILGLTRRSLQANIQALKFGQKYGYPFEYNLEKKVNELRKYVKEKSKDKKTQQMEMLIKLKNYYK